MIESRSVISPLRIDAVEVPGTGGMIGITECPGKDEFYRILPHLNATHANDRDSGVSGDATIDP